MRHWPTVSLAIRNTYSEPHLPYRLTFLCVLAPNSCRLRQHDIGPSSPSRWAPQLLTVFRHLDVSLVLQPFELDIDSPSSFHASNGPMESTASLSALPDICEACPVLHDSDPFLTLPSRKSLKPTLRCNRPRPLLHIDCLQLSRRRKVRL